MRLWLVVGCVALGSLVSAAWGQQVVDPRGPIEYPGMKVKVDAEGVQTVDYTFVNRCAKPTPWQGQWIWQNVNGNRAIASCFRKEITLADAPKEVAAWISADTKYRLYINGKLVARGPVDQGRDFKGGTTGRWFYDYRDLTSYFVKGKNVIAAEVFTKWFGGDNISRGHPGFIFEADMTLPHQGKLMVKSDTTWKAIPADYLGSRALPAKGKKNLDGLVYDVAKEPAGWRLAGFDDSNWPATVSAGNHWGPLIPSEMPPLMEARFPVNKVEKLSGDVTVPAKALQPGHPVIVKSDGSFRVSFDRVLSGHPTLRVKGGPGAVVTIKCHRQATMILGDGVQYFEFPFMTEIVTDITVDVKNVTTPVEFEDVGAVFVSQPVQYKGSFECSDEKLNRIWKVSRWAVQICLQTHHLDSPNHQEPISDPGDYLIEAMVAHNAFAQPWLARQDVRKFAWLLKDLKYHNFHTSYSIGWLQMLMDYYDHTADKALVQEMAPYVHELLDTYASWRGKNGIISEAPNYMFMDWVTISGFGCHHPPAVIGQGYLTAFYYHGLDQGRRIAEIMGDTQRVQKYEKLRKELAVAFNRELWNGGKGLYRDGKPNQTSVKPYQWLPADKNIETFSPHVNLLAVLYDLAPKDRHQAIVEKVLEEKPLNAQPWFYHWVFQAIDHAGLFDKHGTEQMRRWTINKETQSFREMWNGGDLSHGWCSTPLVQMSTRVLGVQPTSPGFKTILIRPTPCDLKFAKGVVPTPQGRVEVSWKSTDSQFSLEVVIPDGMQADVAVPLRFKMPVLRVNEAVVWDGNAPKPGSVDVQKSGGALRVKAGAGKHSFLLIDASEDAKKWSP